MVLGTYDNFVLVLKVYYRSLVNMTMTFDIPMDFETPNTFNKFLFFSSLHVYIFYKNRLGTKKNILFIYLYWGKKFDRGKLSVVNIKYTSNNCYVLISQSYRVV